MARLENKHCFACVLEKWPFPWQLYFAGTWNRAALLSWGCAIFQLCKKCSNWELRDSACWEKATCIEQYFPGITCFHSFMSKKHDKCWTVGPRHLLIMREAQTESLLCLDQCLTSDVTSVGVVIHSDGFQDPVSFRVQIYAPSSQCHRLTMLPKTEPAALLPFYTWPAPSLERQKACASSTAH